MIDIAKRAVDDILNTYREFYKYSIDFTMADMETAAINLFYIYLYDSDSTNVHKLSTPDGATYILENNQDEEKYLEYIRRALKAKAEISNWRPKGYSGNESPRILIEMRSPLE